MNELESALDRLVASCKQTEIVVKRIIDRMEDEEQRAHRRRVDSGIAAVAAAIVFVVAFAVLVMT